MIEQKGPVFTVCVCILGGISSERFSCWDSHVPDSPL